VIYVHDTLRRILRQCAGHAPSVWKILVPFFTCSLSLRENTFYIQKLVNFQGFCPESTGRPGVLRQPPRPPALYSAPVQKFLDPPLIHVYFMVYNNVWTSLLVLRKNFSIHWSFGLDYFNFSAIVQLTLKFWFDWFCFGLQLCLFIYCFTSHSIIFPWYGDITTAGEGLQN
jgi:hypothetical protein